MTVVSWACSEHNDSQAHLWCYLSIAKYIVKDSGQPALLKGCPLSQSVSWIIALPEKEICSTHYCYLLITMKIFALVMRRTTFNHFIKTFWFLWTKFFSHTLDNFKQCFSNRAACQNLSSGLKMFWNYLVVTFSFPRSTGSFLRFQQVI